ncbi:unannotated protein [freshwater metagenome]|uniref:Unannotated protein n=1 Tax=freshwater metagenome TaxID=449393 RepID=A0A6J6ZYN2_9ZZZZ
MRPLFTIVMTWDGPTAELVSGGALLTVNVEYPLPMESNPAPSVGEEELTGPAAEPVMVPF